MSTGLQRCGGEAKPGRRLPDLRGRLEDVRAVLGPQFLDGLAPQRGVRLIPDRNVPPGQVLRIGVGHGFSRYLMSCCRPDSAGRGHGSAIPRREYPGRHRPVLDALRMARHRGATTSDLAVEGNFNHAEP